MIELLIVMVIIGILLAFILSAATDGVRRAEERATQALIGKLESALLDRVNAVTDTRVQSEFAPFYGQGSAYTIGTFTFPYDPYPAYSYLAAVWNSKNVIPTTTTVLPIPSLTRAQLIARFDQLKAELPDVFVVQPDTNYPLNFVAAPYPGSGPGLLGVYESYLLPLGAGVINSPANGSFGNYPSVTPTGTPYPPSTGIFGASYVAAAGFYKSLNQAALTALELNGTSVTLPTPPNAGFDGTDNNANGLIDELIENDPANANGHPIANQMKALLANHTHKTARSEALYALLVNGLGPLGSVFNPDDFNDSEVRDTDGDGLPEFIDAWGQPLQFYRWPIGYVSDLQLGEQAYAGNLAPRDQNPLDPSRLLIDPSWWSATINDSDPYGAAVSLPNTNFYLSGPAALFSTYFFSLVDPNAIPGLKAPPGTVWDRSSNSATPFFARREYYSKFLILSGGLDKTPGVPVLDQQYFVGSSLDSYYQNGNPFTTVPYAVPVGGLAGYPGTTDLLNLQIENRAAPQTPVRSDAVFMYAPGASQSAGALTNPSTSNDFQVLQSSAIAEAGNDDITNHNLSRPGGATP